MGFHLCFQRAQLLSHAELQRNDGSLAIIDGQHRIGMLKILSESKDGKDFDFDRILVEVYSQPEGKDSSSYATQIFQEINKAQPANLVDLPGVAKAEDLEIINTGVATICDLYPKMFSPSTSCRRPHLNMDNVRNELFLNKAIDRHDIKSAEDMVEWMEERNRELAEKYSTEEGRKKVPSKAMEKAQSNNFYLGLDRTWYEE